jgi:glucokinase
VNFFFCNGKVKDNEEEYVQLFSCRSYAFQKSRYSNDHMRLSNTDWIVIEEKFQKKLSTLERKTLFNEIEANAY